MRNIPWKEKFKAFLVHGLCTLLVGSMTAALVFWVWYPRELSEMLAGTRFFGLILLGEVVLGPVLSFVIYNSAKSRWSLVRDYLVIVTVQLAALSYGLFTVFQSRPVYLVFVLDRIEVIAAKELEKAELEKAGLSPFDLPLLGPIFRCVERPTDPSERSALLFSGLEGKDIQMIPRYYRDCHAGEVEKAMLDYALLNQLPRFDAAMLGAGVEAASAGWLPVVTRFGAWVAVYPGRNLSAPIYLNIDPFGH